MPRAGPPAKDSEVHSREKIISLGNLPSWRAAIQAAGKKLVVTNGCFDLLHVGHVTYLEAARAQGDALLVGVNGDAAVRALKGPERPINAEFDRALVLAALGAVDAVCIFPQVRATDFLALAKPDVYVKGGDYTLESLHPDERSVVEELGGRIVIIPLLPGKSTTKVLRGLKALKEERAL